jgi:hypothetical protein
MFRNQKSCNVKCGQNSYIKIGHFLAKYRQIWIMVSFYWVFRMACPIYGNRLYDGTAPPAPLKLAH